MNVDHEITLLIDAIKRLGSQGNGDVLYTVTFGVLFQDEECANIFEALVGTLKAAKKRKVIAYKSEMLLQGVHDNEVIDLLKDSA